MYNRKVVVIPDNTEGDEMKSELIHECHGSMLEGHFGITRTMFKIVDYGYYWPKMQDDITDHVLKCGICQKTRLNLKSRTQLLSIVSPLPMYSVAVDSIGPFEKDKQGFTCVDVYIDQCTKWVELMPKENKQGVPTTNKLLHTVLRHGLPFELQSDNGPEYCNELMKNMLHRLQVHHHKVTVGRSKSNGQVERLNREVERHLLVLMILLEEFDNWSELLPVVQYILNRTVHSSTGFTPYEMMYGHSPIDDKDIVQLLRSKDADKELADAVQTNGVKVARNYIKELKKVLDALLDAAKIKEKTVLEIRAQKYNNGQQPTAYTAGEFVLMLSDNQGPIRNKLKPKFEGPFKVIQVRGLQAKIQSLVDVTQIKEVHMDKLRKFMIRDDEKNNLRKLIAIDKKESVVERIADHIGNSKEDVQFRVHWHGWPESEDTWECYDNVKSCVFLDEYLGTYPSLQKVLTKKSRNSHYKNQDEHDEEDHKGDDQDGEEEPTLSEALDG